MIRSLIRLAAPGIAARATIAMVMTIAVLMSSGAAGRADIRSGSKNAREARGAGRAPKPLTYRGAGRSPLPGVAARTRRNYCYYR